MTWFSRRIRRCRRCGAASLSSTKATTPAAQNSKTRAKKEKENVVPNRAQFARQLAHNAHVAFYSSATYAKRPEVMDLYASTDMRLAVPDISMLPEAIQRGGVRVRNGNELTYCCRDVSGRTAPVSA